jgi:hypothetical protein
MQVIPTEGRTHLDVTFASQPAQSKTHRKGFTFEGCPTSIPTLFQAEIKLNAKSLRASIKSVINDL